MAEVVGRSSEPETASIEGVSHDGRGIAAIRGKKVFVAGGLRGETVRIRRRRRRRHFDEAELLDVIEPSPARIEPRCAAFGVCGGCALQQLPGSGQRAIKFEALKETMARIGGLTPERWLPPIFDGKGEWVYRRRARLAVKDVPAKGRVLVGFRERHAPFVTDMVRCEVLASPLDGLIVDLGELIGGLSIRRRVPQIEAAVGDNAAELVFRVLDPPTPGDEARMVRFGEAKSIRIALQPGGPDSVRPLYPQATAPLYYELPDWGLRLNFEATDFVQVNGPVNRRMIAAAVDLLCSEGSHRVLDLYCGIGNFSLPLARRTGFVLGIEGEARMTARARANAAANGIDNCTFRSADLAAIDGREDWLGERWDRVLLDPPRSGAAAVVQALPRTGAGRVVYLSCHPATLARDAALLVREGAYRLEAAGIIDMFPHTARVEAIAVFAKT
ncbi:MAG TPA: 23S rRNA (uracil(1939)-C(5))-methyltransferase RlmD [Woeseiaceae bacterium]|nr:23S rRNA (uracil(1939)-C(5))-methyltransferase RlmD [Woeseiaceae bacterium]